MEQLTTSKYLVHELSQEVMRMVVCELTMGLVDI